MFKYLKLGMLIVLAATFVPEETVAAIQGKPVTLISPDTPVRKRIETLAGQDIACALVVDKQRLVGIFSDRDVLDKVPLEYHEVKDVPVSEIITKNPPQRVAAFLLEHSEDGK